jgi:hypothetical protein
LWPPRLRDAILSVLDAEAVAVRAGQESTLDGVQDGPHSCFVTP